MKEDFTIREAQQSDAVALKELFQNTVLVINRRDYSQSEVEDWASCGDNLSEIESTLTNRWFFIYYAPRLFTFYVCSQGLSR